MLARKISKTSSPVISDNNNDHLSVSNRDITKLNLFGRGEGGCFGSKHWGAKVIWEKLGSNWYKKFGVNYILNLILRGDFKLNSIVL